MTKSDDIDQISSMFEAARSLIGGSKIIIASDGIEENSIVRKPTLPVVVSSALAIEIQLKALLQLNGAARPSGSGHDIFTLFRALPSDLQKSLLEHQVRFTDFTSEQALSMLEDHRDAFVTWRYPYEKSLLEVAPAFLFGFALSLSEFLQQTVEIERSDNGWLREDG